MAAEENLGSIYVAIKSKTDQLDAELRALKQRMSKEKTDLEQRSSFQMKFDTAVAKMKIEDVRKLRVKLQKEFDKKVAMNADVASIERTKIKLNSVERALEGTEKAAERTGRSLRSRFVNAFTIAALGVGTLVLALRSFISRAIDAARSQAGVEQAVRKTGHAAGLTAIELQKIATELQKITGVGDDDILRNVTRQLLTFTKVTGDVFKRAQVAVLDLNATINDGAVGSLTSQSIQLGKALEDPIAGIGALTRAGVTFTEEQKKSIRNYVQQNDLMSAQNIILSEIEAKYGGQAKALADASAGTMQLKEAWGDLTETVGEFFRPFLTKWLPEITKGIKGWIILLQDAREEFGKFLKLGSQERQSAWFDSLQNSSKEYRDSERARIKDEIEANKQLWNEKQQQIEQLKKLGFIKFGDQISKLEQEQKQLSFLNTSYRDYIKAIDDFEKKQEQSTNKLTESWSAAGKTLGQLKDRVAELQERLDNLEPGSIDFRKTEAEIKRLNEIINPKSEQKSFKGRGQEKFLDFDKDALDRMVKDYEGSLSLIKLQKGELVLFMKETDQQIVDNSMFSTEAIVNDWIEKNELLRRSQDIMVDGFTDAFHEMRIRVSSEASAITKIFVDMANAFIREVQRMIAQWMVFQLIRGALTFATGGAGAAIPVPAGHSGGNFIGTSKGVKKMAGGGSFIVPQGYPNDSYPLLVESGERVSVTPASRVNAQDRLLAEINNSIRAMNMNLVRKDLSVNIENRSSETEVMVKRLKKIENKLSSAGVNFSER